MRVEWPYCHEEKDRKGMLITDSFVLLNLPRSGSSFAREVIQHIYMERFHRRNPLIPVSVLAGALGLQKRLLTRYGFPMDFRELMLPNLQEGNEYQHGQHGGWSQIPRKYLNREVVSIIRNPYERQLSGYRHRWWARYPILGPDVLSAEFPQFPNLSFDDYLRFQDFGLARRMPNGQRPDANVGPQTVQFIWMFFKNPMQTLEMLTDEYLDSDRIFDDIADVTFLQNDRLSDVLAAFLQHHGANEDEVRYVLTHKRVNASKGDGAKQETTWTPKWISYVREKERMIFRILESRGFFYDAPLTSED